MNNPTVLTVPGKITVTGNQDTEFWLKPPDGNVVNQWQLAPPTVQQNGLRLRLVSLATGAVANLMDGSYWGNSATLGIGGTHAVQAQFNTTPPASLELEAINGIWVVINLQGIAFQ